jgi:hypothetical protein
VSAASSRGNRKRKGKERKKEVLLDLSQKILVWKFGGKEPLWHPAGGRAVGRVEASPAFNTEQFRANANSIPNLGAPDPETGTFLLATAPMLASSVARATRELAAPSYPSRGCTEDRVFERGKPSCVSAQRLPEFRWNRRQGDFSQPFAFDVIALGHDSIGEGQVALSTLLLPHFKGFVIPLGHT